MTEGSIRTRPDKNIRKKDEIRLLQAARQDPRAFGELYLQYVEQVFRYLFSRLGNIQEAEDATAQAFLSAFESFGRFRENDHFASWLFTIARNKAMDQFRQRKNLESIHDIDNIPAEEDPLSSVIQSEQATALSQIILNLPEEERELLRLRFLAEMTYREIGHFLKSNEEAIKKTTYRLLARLQSQLEVSNE